MEDIIITFVLCMNIFISTIDVKRSSLMHQFRFTDGKRLAAFLCCHC
jgi:hypothetical protein